MNEAQLLKVIDLPKPTHVLKTLPYNQLETRLTAAQKKVISEQVVARGMRILASIQTNNTNIEAFESETERFDAIVFLAIHLKNIKKAAQIYKIFMNVMPNPLVILFYDVHTRWLFSIHEKKNDGYLAIKQLYEIQEAVTLEQVEQHLNFDELNKTNLKTFYESWLERMLQIELQVRYSVYAPVTLQNNVLEKLVVMDEQIDDYVKQAKKETQLNKRVELQQAANKVKEQKAKLITKMQS
ncbi:DUF4391 domain-containing protein [Peribacillus sp. NPDC097197]|uniref:DUF4391 domain-containing protein n=1 Tax=Peribacillus sp. NPDC097197 TaxID=3390615 RepID=UPI003CFF9838